MTTLVELQGGRPQWEKAQRRLDELGWPCHELTPKERRVARRDLDADPAVSEFRWVEVPVTGSSWRADREAAWRVTELSKSAQAVVYGRLFQRDETDRLMEPEWQVYAAGRPAGDAARRAPTRRLLAAGRWMAARSGLLDDHVRVHAGRDAALHLARHMHPDGPRADLYVRPLDGRGRTGTVQHREDALNRALALFMGPLFAMALFVTLARHTRSTTAVVCWFLALVCAVPAWWTAFALPLSRTRLRCLAASAVATLGMACYALGVPGLSDGLHPKYALTAAGVAFYATGLVLLGRRRRWQVLSAGALPLLATLLVAALPLTGRILQDGYADELSLTPEETAVSGVWQIVSAVKLLWPTIGAILFVAATWGIMRYFHFIRPRSLFAAICAALFLVLGVTLSVDATLSSPQRAAELLRKAAVQHTAAPGYFGISTDWTCVRPTVPARSLNEQGGTLSPDTPYLSFGVADGSVVLWNPSAEQPLRVPAGQVKLLLPGKPGRTCTL
ncbi:hypothetical protein ABZ837_00080 [Streptomyces sp. NPDC047197]|uniref:hypothetical protein n=1 Tax=Streptomyces sp. NPDC047197 TaxID=3155477 RepID=UPI0033F7231F